MINQEISIQLSDFAMNYSKLKILMGSVLWSVAFILYLLFESTRLFFLPPLGLLSFGGGTFLFIQESEKFQILRKLIIPFIAGIFIFWIFLTTQLDIYILQTPLANIMTDLTVLVTVLALNGLGILATHQGNLIIFPAASKVSSVYIDARCGGVHSFLIFVCCFIVILLREGYTVPRRKIAISSLIGIAGTLVTNYIRVIIVCLVGIFYGTELMFWTHNYAGFALFLTWLTAFWYLALSYLLQEK